MSIYLLHILSMISVFFFIVFCIFRFLVARDWFHLFVFARNLFFIRKTAISGNIWGICYKFVWDRKSFIVVDNYNITVLGIGDADGVCPWSAFSWWLLCYVSKRTLWTNVCVAKPTSSVSCIWWRLCYPTVDWFKYYKVVFHQKFHSFIKTCSGNISSR